jgi:hypothetical protein
VRTMNTEVVERLHRTKKDSDEIVQ